jgi:hypothetical protein
MDKELDVMYTNADTLTKTEGATNDCTTELEADVMLITEIKPKYFKEL